MLVHGGAESDPDVIERRAWVRHAFLPFMRPTNDRLKPLDEESGEEYLTALRPLPRGRPEYESRQA